MADERNHENEVLASIAVSLFDSGITGHLPLSQPPFRGARHCSGGVIVRSRFRQKWFLAVIDIHNESTRTAVDEASVTVTAVCGIDADAVSSLQPLLDPIARFRQRLGRRARGAAHH